MFESALTSLEARLRDHISKSANPLSAPMRHAVLAGGKRLRPRLFMTVVALYGLKPEAYLDVACALEMIHASSLVHDDLPAMDDDDLRRGQPTVHVAYDEATAILVGDALLVDAFYVLANAENVTGEARIKLVGILAEKAGSMGMIAGQVIDLQTTQKTPDIETLNTMHQLKTAALLEAALMMGGVVAGVADLAQFEQCGRTLGLAFQIQDDILDVESTQAQMGKSLSDHVNEKASYVRIVGLEAAKRRCASLFEQVYALCDTLSVDAQPLRELIRTIQYRTT